MADPLDGAVEALGVAVPRRDAEAMRRRLHEAGLLRQDLRVRRDGDHVIFPVLSAPPGEATVRHAFEAQPLRVARYQDFLPWPEGERDVAPRAFDRVGEIVVVKVPEPLWERRAEIGEALLRFHAGVRAVFHDRGVKGEFRTRELERIAGTGGAATVVNENGVRLHVDLSAAYFSPRLADERARVASLVRPGEQAVDLFGGVAPFGVQAARAGAEVVSVDLNPAAVELARRNADENRVALDIRLGDAREVAAALIGEGRRFDRIFMNLPHGARAFLDVAAALVRSGGTIHHNEIVEDDRVEPLRSELERTMMELGRPVRVAVARHVRAYSADTSHWAFDLVAQEPGTADAGAEEMG